MDLLFDQVAVDFHAGFEGGREGELRQPPMHRVGVLRRQCLHPNELAGEVVNASGGLGYADQILADRLQIRSVRDPLDERARVDEVVNTVGRQQEDIARLELQRPVVDLEAHIHSDGAAQVGVLLADLRHVITRQLFEGIVADAMDARITDVKEMGRM